MTHPLDDPQHRHELEHGPSKSRFGRPRVCPCDHAHPADLINAPWVAVVLLCIAVLMLLALLIVSVVAGGGCV